MVRWSVSKGIAWTLAALLASLAFFGCGYSLPGRGASPLMTGIDSVGIPLIGNQTDRPQIEQRVTEALVDQFIRRGNYDVLPGPDGADAVLEGLILSYRLDPVTFTEKGRFDRVEVVMTAKMRLIRSSPTEVLWTNNNFVFRQQYDVPETPASDIDRELVAIEDVSRDFALSVVTSIFEGF